MNGYMWHEKPKDIVFIKVDNTYVQLERVYKGDKYNTESLKTPLFILACFLLGFLYVI